MTRKDPGHWQLNKDASKQNVTMPPQDMFCTIQHYKNGHYRQDTNTFKIQFWHIVYTGILVLMPLEIFIINCTTYVWQLNGKTGGWIILTFICWNHTKRFSRHIPLLNFLLFKSEPLFGYHNNYSLIKN